MTPSRRDGPRAAGSPAKRPRLTLFGFIARSQAKRRIEWGRPSPNYRPKQLKDIYFSEACRSGFRSDLAWILLLRIWFLLRWIWFLLR